MPGRLLDKDQQKGTVLNRQEDIPQQLPTLTGPPANSFQQQVDLTNGTTPVLHSAQHLDRHILLDLKSAIVLACDFDRLFFSEPINDDRI